MKYIFLFLFSLLLIHNNTNAQSNASKVVVTDSSKLVQFSGLVLAGDNQHNLVPVPYTSIYLKNRKRGTYSDFKGFFSFVAQKGDKVVFSSVGYKTIEVRVPDTLRDNRYSVVQLMTKDTINLPETVIFPWPNRDHFKTEFLAMDVTSDLQQKAIENLADNALKKMRNEVLWDGKELGQHFLREQAKSYYSVGQFRPMNIFSPLAWGEFFKAWQEGKFKIKKDANDND